MPTVRLTQEPVRTLVLPTDANLRVTQEPVRTLVLPTDANLRVTQVALRVLRLNDFYGMALNGSAIVTFGLPVVGSGKLTLDGNPSIYVQYQLTASSGINITGQF